MKTGTIIHAFLLLLFLIPESQAQESDPFKPVQTALLHGRKNEAQQLLAQIQPLNKDPSFLAKISLLEAAMVERPYRAQAFLQVAQGFPEQEEGLTALIACLHYLNDELVERGRDYTYSREDEMDNNSLFTPCLSLYKAWLQREADDPRVRMAKILLDSLNLTLASKQLYEPLYLNEDEKIPVPLPLAEKARLVLYKLDDWDLLFDQSPGRINKSLRAHLLDGHSPEPYVALEILPGAMDFEQLAPSPGVYLLEMISVETGNKRRIILVVTDLNVVGCSGADGFALLTCMGDQAVQGVKVFAQGELIGVTDEQGFLAAPFPKTTKDEEILLLCDAGGHKKMIRINKQDREIDKPPQITSHLFLDRSIYRPGEEVKGRLVVRKHERAKPIKGLFSSLTDSAPVSSPLKNHDVFVVLRRKDEFFKRVDLKTDAFGVVCFTCPIKPTDPTGDVDICAWAPLTQEEEYEGAVEYTNPVEKFVSLGSWSRILQVQDYKRPPLLWEVKCDSTEVNISASYPNGSPAAGLTGYLTGTFRNMDRRMRFNLDHGGNRRLNLISKGLNHLYWEKIPCKVEIQAADGQTLVKEFVVKRDKPIEPPKSKPKSKDHRFRLVAPKNPWPLGKEAPIQIQGPAGRPVLVAVGRSGVFYAKAITLNGRGQAVVSIPTSKDWGPRVTVSASLGGKENEYDQECLRFKDPDKGLGIALKLDKPEVGPGEKVCWEILTCDSENKPIPACVAISVLDERLACLMDDRLKDPYASLSPRWGWCSLQHNSNLENQFMESSFSRLLFDGKVLSPFSDIYSAYCGWAAGPTTGSGGKTAVPAPRTKFRKNAFFSGSILTGPDGRAEVSFSFPHDLTNWRIMLAAVDQGRQAAYLEKSVRTVRDPALTPVLPRLMRMGDRVKAPVLAQAVKKELPSKGFLEFNAQAPLCLEGKKRFTFPMDPGRTQERLASLHAQATGVGLISSRLTTSQGELMDQIDLKLKVESREVTQKLWSVVSLKEKNKVLPPSLDNKTPDKLRVEIIGGLKSFQQKARTFLEKYPYGCAEQVSSCLYPILLDELPLSTAQVKRLEYGLNRLRLYQNQDNGFTWWGRGSTDPQITACVLEFLALMREKGLDPQEYGIRLDPESAIFKGSKNPEEMAVARLLLFPKHLTAIQDCLALTDKVHLHPAGLMARCGKALALANRTEAANRILQHICSKTSWDLKSSDLRESPAASWAAMLDLVLILDPQNAKRDELLIEMIRCYQGDCFDHTFGTALVLRTLSRFLNLFPEREDGKEVRVKLTGSGFSRRVSLTTENNWEGSCSFPYVEEEILIENPSKKRLLFVLEAEFSEDGGEAKSVCKPLKVKRKLYRLLPGKTGALTRREPVDRIRKGEVLEAFITVEGLEGRSYLVLDCPIPAGFEAIKTRQDEEIRDARAIRLVYGKPKTSWSLRLTPVMEGEMVWPAVYAMDMYDQKCWGRSSGRRLEVGPAALTKQALASLDVFSPSYVKSLVPFYREKLIKASNEKEFITAFQGLVDLPCKPDEDWFLRKAPKIIGVRFNLEKVSDLYVKALGKRVQEALIAVKELKGADYQMVLIHFARALQYQVDKTADLKDKALAALVGFFKDQRNDAAYLCQLRTGYKEIPEGLRAETVADKIIYDIEPEDADEELLMEMAFATLWAWDNTDLNTKASLAEALLEFCSDLKKPGPRLIKTNLTGLLKKTFLENITLVKDKEFDGLMEDIYCLAVDGLAATEHKELNRKAMDRVMGLKDHTETFIACAGRVLELTYWDEADRKDLELSDSLGLALFYKNFKSMDQANWEHVPDFDYLSKKAIKSIPYPYLLSLVLDGYTGDLSEELLDRDGLANRALLHAAPHINSDWIKEQAVMNASAASLNETPLSILLHLLPEEGWETSGEITAGDRIKGELDGPRFKDEEMVQALIESRTPHVRYQLVRSLEKRGKGDVAFSPQDKAAYYYKAILQASLGDPVAQDLVKQWLQGPGLSSGDRAALLWALREKLTLGDLRKLQTDVKDLYIPGSIMDIVLKRSDPEEVLSLCKKSPVFCKHEMIVPFLLTNAVTLNRMIKDASQIPLHLAEEIAQNLDWRSPLGVCGVRVLRNYPDESIQRHIKYFLTKTFGDPQTWLAKGGWDQLVSVYGRLLDGKSSFLNEEEKKIAGALLSRFGLYISGY